MGVLQDCLYPPLTTSSSYPPNSTLDMQIGGVKCAISQIWPKFREMLGKNPADIYFDLRLLGLWGVMNIMNCFVEMQFERPYVGMINADHNVATWD